MTVEHPSKETGTMSVHNGQDDMRNISRLGWEGVQKSQIYSRGLQDSINVKELKEDYRDFKEGQITLGELLDRVDNL